jgi:hypothetical protein
MPHCNQNRNGVVVTEEIPETYFKIQVKNQKHELNGAFIE